jgi:transcriptional regulator with XRE-family HTH domain
MQLEAIRKSKNMSIYKLSKESGVSQPYLKDIESEKKSPTLRVLQKIAAALKVPITQLIDETPKIKNGY